MEKRSPFSSSYGHLWGFIVPVLVVALFFLCIAAFNTVNAQETGTDQTTSEAASPADEAKSDEQAKPENQDQPAQDASSGEETQPPAEEETSEPSTAEETKPAPEAADQKAAETVKEEPKPAEEKAEAPKPAEESKPAEEPEPAEETADSEQAETPTEVKTEEKAETAQTEEQKPEQEAKSAEEKAEEPPAEEKEEEAEPEEEEAAELSNESCMDCHSKDILEMDKEDFEDMVEVGDEPAKEKVRPLFSVGELSLYINLDKYNDSVHADTSCTDCHTDIEEIPHAQRLNKVDCSECHDVETVQASAHGEAAKKQIGCVGCHDVHYSEAAGSNEEEWKTKYCMECHEKYGMDTKDAHKELYEFELHQKALGCMTCHQGDDATVHGIPQVATKVADCEACHSKYSILTDEMYKPAASVIDYYSQTSFINASSLKEYGYVVGSHRIPLLDLIVILLVLGPIALPLVHGGLRIITRRKEPLELPDEKILLHPLLERLWHWAQALCIVILIITGIIIHWPEYFKGWFDFAVSVHNWFGIATVVLFLIWLLYNIFSGRISHYFPNKGDIPRRVIVQAKFYGWGIFKHEPHPYPPREDDKFNPLQKLAYLSFQVVLMPILLISGILYMYPETFSGVIEAIGGMTVLAIIHYLLGALFASFLVAHLYLATTGETIGENFKAIITGYGIKEEHGHGHDDDKVEKA